MTTDTGERMEVSRDLKQQIAELNGRDDDREIIIRDTSPARRRVILYSMVDGEPLRLPEYMAEKAMEKRLPSGGFMFTTDPTKAPAYRRGTIKCFLHPESNERPVLREIGISNICDAETLGSPYSKRIHAEHRHKQEWAIYQEWLTEQEKEGDKGRQQGQIDAMLALAGKAASAEPVPHEPAIRLPRERQPMTEEQRQRARENLAKARAARGVHKEP